MKRATFALVVLLCSIGAGHIAVLYYGPTFIMGRAMEAMANRGIPTHAFRLAPRMTPQTQTVVRPSPDLAYSLCRFDFSDGVEAVEIGMAAWDDYGSVSLYDAQTNNFVSFRSEGEPFSMRLLPPLSEPDGFDIPAPTEKGVILIRRLAPTQQAYREIERIAVKDVCRAVKQGGTGS